MRFWLHGVQWSGEFRIRGRIPSKLTGAYLWQSISLCHPSHMTFFEICKTYLRTYRNKCGRSGHRGRERVLVRFKLRSIRLFRKFRGRGSVLSRLTGACLRPSPFLHRSYRPPFFTKTCKNILTNMHEHANLSVEGVSEYGPIFNNRPPSCG